MLINLEKKDTTPLYQNLVDYFVRNIKSGTLPPGYKLPTVRALSKENRIAQGTVKHAYDTLEQLGYIKMSQGRGSFVCDANKTTTTGKKDQAMEAIEKLIDRMTELSFSPQEIRIFLDLKLRERENMANYVRLGAIDCAPESLAAMTGHLSTLENIDIYPYLLPDLLASPEPVSPNLDLIVTTPTHYTELEAKLSGQQNLIRLVMSVSGDTLLSIARIPSHNTVGILCASARYAEIIANTLAQYQIESKSMQTALFGDEHAVVALIAATDYLILPDNYRQYASKQEQEIIRQRQNPERLILFRYQIERGSLLYLEEQLRDIRQKHAD